MNTLESSIVVNPFGKEEVVAKFIIDDVTDIFNLLDITLVGQEYTFSGWIKSETAGFIKLDNTAISTNSVWTKYTHTFKASDTAFVMAFQTVGTYYLYQSKLELGNKATDWTPAPEDMATGDAVQNAQNTADRAGATASAVAGQAGLLQEAIEKLENAIAMLVTDANGESLMTQTADGWTFSIATLQEAVDAASDSVDALSKELGDTNSTVNVLQQAVNDLGKTAEYVRITVYEDEPCIELGESDSNFKLLITNTRIMFMEGSDVPTYISNKGLTTKNIEIENDLIQGGYVWRIRANGNLGLMWMGGTE